MASSDFKKLVLIVDKNNNDFSHIKEKINNVIIQELDYLILAKNSVDKDIENQSNSTYSNMVIKYAKIEDISEVNIKEWSISANNIIDLLTNLLIEMEKQDIEKFIIKMNKFDPITGESRYGPEMCKKIKFYQDIIIQLIENIKMTKNILQEKIDIYNTYFPAIIEPVKEIKIPLETLFDNINKNEIDQIELKKRKQEEELLRIEADKIRLKKQLEIERIELKKKELNETILEINKINKINSNLKSNLYNLMNKFNDSNNIDNSQRNNLIKFLINLLNNVISKPDDILLRKLKVNNPILFDKVITIQYGLNILLALGFYLKLEISQDGGNTENLIKSTNIILPPASIEFDLSTNTDSTDIKKFNLLTMLTTCDSIQSNLFLEMNEPDPTSSEGMTKWIDWFDKLKESLDILEIFKSKL